MVDELVAYFTKHLLLVILVLTRLSTLLTALPAVGVGVPMRIRALLALVLTLLIAPAVSDLSAGELPRASSQVELAIMLGREALVGLLIGSVTQILVTGVQLAGEFMTGTGGMQLGDAIDPTTRSTMPSLAQLLGLLVVAVMITMGGHRLLLDSLIDSFRSLPPGKIGLDDSMMSLVVTQMTSSFAAAIRIAAPVVAAMLLCNLVTGLISRTLPQINVLAIGLSINAVALLAVAALSIGSAGYVFQEEFSATIERLGQLWADLKS